MRIGTVLAVALWAGAAGLATPGRGAARAVRASRVRMSATEGTKLEAREVANKKQERRRIMASPDFLRKNGDFVAEKAAVDAKMLREMKSRMLDEMRDSSYETTRGEDRVRIVDPIERDTDRSARVAHPPILSVVCTTRT